MISTDPSTTQLEMRYLAHVTGDWSFAEKAKRFYSEVQKYKSLDGLWQNCFQTNQRMIHFGADGDSFYEYLLKGLEHKDVVFRMGRSFEVMAAPCQVEYVFQAIDHLCMFAMNSGI